MDKLPVGWKQKSPKQMAAIVILILMAMVLSFVEFPLIPSTEWLEYDFSGVISILTTLLYGPVVGTIVAVVSWIPHMVTDPLGAFMNITATLMLLLVVSALYRRKPCLKNAVIGCAVGVVVSTGVAVCLNFVVTPMYMSTTYEAIVALVVPALIPFNVIKSLLNSVLAVVSYRKLAELLAEPESVAQQN